MYMSISLSNDDILHLTRSPSIKSWSLFVGILSLGLGAAYYSTDHLLLKVLYIIGCVILGLSVLEEWEDCIIDKSEDNIILTRNSSFQKLLKQNESRHVTIPISNVMNVCVERRKNSSTELKARHVVLVLKSGFSVPISECATDYINSELHLIAEKIRVFLKLSRIEIVEDEGDSSSLYQSYTDNNSSDSSDQEQQDQNGYPREAITLLNEVNQ